MCPEKFSSLETGFSISDGELRFNGRTVLYDVPPNINLSPYSSLCSPSAPFPCNGGFLGFDASTADSLHRVSLGKLKDIRFTSIFRFKLWWTTQWVGDRGSDLETETQVLILDTAGKFASEGCTDFPYLLLLPIYEGKFRAALQAGSDDNVDVCVESGSTAVRESSFKSCVYLHAFHDPFLLVKEAVKALSVHLGTFRHLEDKVPPSIVDKFGWCTWDAFYLTVNPEGIWEGVKALVEGGVPPKFLIIDDGWQSISYDHQDPSEDATQQTVAGDQMWCRLTRVQENSKFRDYVGGTLPKRQVEKKSCTRGDCNGKVHDDQMQLMSEESLNKGMGAFIRDLKRNYSSLDDIYVWHALAGYWGGVRPNVPESFESQLVQPVRAPGLLSTMEDLAVDKIVTNTVGLVPPEHAHSFYDRLHSYLAKCGVSGVKMDVIHVLELLGEGYGGRMELCRAYYEAVSASMKKNLGGNRVIASMEHCNDFMLTGTEQISFGRVGDDFWTEDANGDPLLWLQGFHMVHCAYNSIWMGQFIHPDWDMFQTTHCTAAFHAASRAICGGPIYVSDKPGRHDFKLLKKMVFPDGTIPRCVAFALPTRDCLFSSPMHDGDTILKIWNLNKHGGVIGAFNCQGGHWSRKDRCTKPSLEHRVRCSTDVSPQDIEWAHASPSLCVENVQSFVVYSMQSDKILILKKNESMSLLLDPLGFELYTVFPVQKVIGGLHFAPIGLLNMLNSGGCVESMEMKDSSIASEECEVTVKIRGVGTFGAYASYKPKMCRLEDNHIDSSYGLEDGRIVLDVPWKCGYSILTFIFSK